MREAQTPDPAQAPVATRRTAPGTRTSAGKKIVFAAVAVVAILAAAESALWALGVERRIDREDPFRGFSGLIDVFEPAGDVYRTRPAVAATFNEQSFAREKPANGLRTFTLGGSSSYGFPWGAPAAFTAILGDALARAHPERTVEAVNASGVSYAMHRLNLVLDELVDYQPDIVVVYSGHNEFIEPEFFEALKSRGTVRNRVEYALAHSRVYSGLYALLRGDGREQAAEPRFDAEVRRDRSRRFSTDEKKAIVAEYRFRLERLVQHARAAGSKVVLVTVPANLRDWRPEASIVGRSPDTNPGENPADLDERAGNAWARDFNAGTAQLARREYAQALEAFRRALAISPEHAGTHYFAGRCHEGLGRYEEARRAYERACDLDASPSRRISGINDAIREVARAEGVLLVDADRIFAEASAHGLVGFDLVEDYVHPTHAGHELIAWLLWQAIEATGWLGDVSPVRREDFDAVLAERGAPVDQGHPSWLYNQGVVLENQGRERQAMDKYRQALALAPDHGGALGNLTRLLVQEGDYAAARPLAERLVTTYPERQQFAIVLGVIQLNQGELDGARARFESVLERDADSALGHHNLGRVLELQGEDAAARPHFERALAARPDLAAFHFRRGEELFRGGDLARAPLHLGYAVRGQARPVEAHYYLGLLASRAGDMAAALRHFETAVGLAPQHTGSLIRGAWIKATSGNADLRDERQALEWARTAAQLTRFEDAASLDTLAAASAAAGLFDEAVRWQTAAIERVPERLQPQLRARLTLYSQGRPYVEGAQPTPGPRS